MGAVLVLHLVVLHSADSNSYHAGRSQTAGTTGAAALYLLGASMVHSAVLMCTAYFLSYLIF